MHFKSPRQCPFLKNILNRRLTGNAVAAAGGGTGVAGVGIFGGTCFLALLAAAPPAELGVAAGLRGRLMADPGVPKEGIFINPFSNYWLTIYMFCNKSQ